MEASSSSGRIKKFNERPSTISLREFKATFSTVVCELELKYGANYWSICIQITSPLCALWSIGCLQATFSKDVGFIQTPNLAYAATITIASQGTLQPTIAHHGTVPNNPNLIATSVNISLQQFIATTANNLPTIDAPAFADPVGEFFWVLKLEFLFNSFETNLPLTTFFQQKYETFKMLYRRLLKLKEDT